MTLQDIMDRLITEGYENCHFSNGQIIVNNRGEIELAYGEAQIFDRLAPWPGYGNHAATSNIDTLFADINATWTKEEFPCSPSSSESSPSSKEAVEVTATKDVVLAPVTDIKE